MAGAAAVDSGPTPAQDVETSLELPVVVVQESLLSVKASGPQNVTAGTSFPFSLQVRPSQRRPLGTVNWGALPYLPVRRCQGKLITAVMGAVAAAQRQEGACHQG